MDYELKYKNALEWARMVMNGETGFIREEVIEVFPELAESEDEKIRRDIISYIQVANQVLPQFQKDNWLAWLEKQGEQKTCLPKWKYKKDHTPLLRDSIILNKYDCVAKSPSGAIVSDVWVLDYDELAKLPKEEIEKQDKQNSPILSNSAKTGKNWAEEDEELLQHCCGAVAAADYYTLEDKEEMENWLKSIKKRMEDEQ